MIVVVEVCEMSPGYDTRDAEGREESGCGEDMCGVILVDEWRRHEFKRRGL